VALLTGYVKDCMYTTLVANINDLKVRIAVETVNVEMLQCIQKEIECQGFRET
jgi:hypothetical protein